MSATATPASAPYFEPDPLLHDLLAVSLTAINLLRPCYNPAGELDDFAPEYFNPAAQRMTGLPERPVGTARTLFPDIFNNGIFAFYRKVFETGEPDKFQRYYQADGLDNYFYIAARRSGERLLVSFTDTADQVRTAAEDALRATQAAEQAARATAERQRGELAYVVARSPVAMGLLRGPNFIIELANTRMSQLWGRPAEQLLGQPHFEALPDLAGQGFEQVLLDVLTTGQAHEQWEQPVLIAQPEQLYQAYLNIAYLPDYDASGQPAGILIYATDVTAQVRARQQVQTLNEGLTALNEELRASNAEYQQANTALGAAQQQLQQLNQELETRVRERTEVARVALDTAERERNLLQALLTQAPVAIGFFQGEDLRITSANAQLATMWGRTAEQVVGQPFMDAVPELRGQGFEEQMRQVMHTQVPVRGTETPATMLRDGRLQTTYYDFVYQPLYDTEGQLLGVIDVAVEVTEQVLARRQVEQLNQELEARVQERTQQLAAAQAATERERALLQTLFAQAPVAIGLLQGDDLHVVSANSLMAAIWGHTPAQVVGRPLLAGVPELQGQGFDDLLRQVLHTQVPFIGTEMPAELLRDGQLQTSYYNFVYQPLYDADGQVVGVIDVALDVTEQVLARRQVEQLNAELEARVQARTEELTATNEELNQSNTQLTRTNVDLDTFVYTASHDLKAPITNIESIVIALRDTLPTAVQQDGVVAHLLTLLDTTVARFRLTIDQLTDISKLQLAHAGPAEPVQLAQVIENVRLDLAPNMLAADTQLTVEVPAGLVVSFSPSNLRSIVYNLLSNAIKYHDSARPSQVLLRAEQTAAAVVLVVQDNGLGMSEVQQRQLFGLFQRLHTHVEGTGVGLYISKRLVENGGGTIAVQSQVDAGTTFTVTFPA